MLIFKFSKNDKNDKKKLEEQEEMLMTDYVTEKPRESNFDGLK